MSFDLHMYMIQLGISLPWIPQKTKPLCYCFISTFPKGTTSHKKGCKARSIALVSMKQGTIRLPLSKLNGRSCIAVICFGGRHIKIGPNTEDRTGITGS